MSLTLKTSRESQEARIGRIEQGRKAIQAGAVIEPYLAEEVARINNAMIAGYRDPEVGELRFFGLAAELTALRNLEERIDTDRRRGVVALDQEVADGTAP